MSVVRKIVHSNLAPAAIGPYSQAVQVDRTLYISGQLGLDTQTGSLVEGVAAQAKKALENMGHILEAAGASYKSVVKTTVLLADMKDFGTVNDVYRTSTHGQMLVFERGGAGDQVVEIDGVDGPPDYPGATVVSFFADNFPARAAYQVAALPRGGLVEIEAIAVVGPIQEETQASL